MIEVVDDPWPGNPDDPSVYHMSCPPMSEGSYYIRLCNITFKLDYQEMVGLRNRISAVIRDREFGIPL